MDQGIVPLTEEHADAVTEKESIRFHSKKGFEICGRFRRVGIKNGRDFDLVWMQKML